jgi:hypothetical protein
MTVTSSGDTRFWLRRTDAEAGLVPFVLFFKGTPKIINKRKKRTSKGEKKRKRIDPDPFGSPTD